MSPAAKLVLLASLYLAQGLPFGFFTQFLPAMLREQGVSLEKIGLASLLALPWALKFLWAPLVDRHGWSRVGLRRTWILPLQALAVLVLLGLATISPTRDLQALLLGVLALNLLAATQDIATDGLAVEILGPAERGLGNGVQVAGYRLGMILAGGVLLILAERLGWALCCQLMAGAIALTTLPIAGFREPPAPPAERPGLAAFAGFFRRPGTTGWLAALLAFKVGESFGVAMLRPFFIDAGLTLADIGWLTGTAGFLASLIGAMVGGALVGAYGRWRCLFLFGAAQALAVAAYALPAWTFVPGAPPDRALLYALCSLEHFISGMATVALFTLMMDAARPQTAGTDYTVQASLVVLGTGLAATLSGLSAGAWGYAAHFLVGAGLCVLGMLPAAVHRARVRRGATAVAAIA